MKFSLPDWLQETPGLVIAEPEARMRFVIALSRQNVEHGTGGPFGAAIFESASGRLVACGVNRVVASACSHAHAEMTAIANAQHALGNYDLGAASLPAHELVTSSEPCAMCFGALPWSGVRRLVCGARAADAEAIGFDEGPKPANWTEALQQRGIAVLQDICRDEAIAVLRAYQQAGAEIYNSRQR
jgi:tRNA(Arg) A34 adenosine deaminase TadA